MQAFLKQFAQWRSERLFGSAGPWQLLKNLNSKLEASCKQSDMAGNSMFQAVYVLAPNSSVASVSCALPSPRSLVMGAAAAKPASASGVPLPSSKSKAGGKSKAVDKVMCTYCEEMFGKKGIKNHEATTKPSVQSSTGPNPQVGNSTSTSLQVTTTTRTTSWTADSKAPRRPPSHPNRHLPSRSPTPQQLQNSSLLQH